MSYEDIPYVGELLINTTLTIKIPVVSEVQGDIERNGEQYMKAIEQEMAELLKEELNWLMETNVGISELVSDVSCNAVYMPKGE